MLYCDCYETVYVNEEMLTSWDCGKGYETVGGEDCVGSFGRFSHRRSVDEFCTGFTYRLGKNIFLGNWGRSMKLFCRRDEV